MPLLGCYFEEFIAVLSGEKDKLSTTQIMSELLMGDDNNLYTLVKYLRQNQSIPCSCLNEKYEGSEIYNKDGNVLQFDVSFA